MDAPLTDKDYLLEKFSGKGGWTYVKISEIKQDKSAPFGFVRVSGTIDNYEIRNYNLMPMGNGRLFLPVKAEIRKKIQKQAGDYVKLTLYASNAPTEIPEELKECLLNEADALDKFLAYSNAEQKRIIDWIYSAKTDKTKIDRIVKTIDRLV